VIDVAELDKISIRYQAVEGGIDLKLAQTRLQELPINLKTLNCNPFSRLLGKNQNWL